MQCYPLYSTRYPGDHGPDQVVDYRIFDGHTPHQNWLHLPRYGTTPHIYAQMQCHVLIARLRYDNMDQDPYDVIDLDTCLMLKKILLIETRLPDKREYTDAEVNRLDTAAARMPGAFRVACNWRAARGGEDIPESAESVGCGEHHDTFHRIHITGGRTVAKRSKVQTRGVAEDIPGNTYGIRMAEVSIHPG